MKVLVTGGCGFIGRFLVRELLRQGIEGVRILDIKEDKELLLSFDENVDFWNMSINDSKHMEDVLEGIDIVYHLAGLLGTMELFARVIEAEKINVLGTLNILEAMRKKDVKKIIYYSKPNIWKHNSYTITKENCERYLQMYHKVYGIRPVILCPYNVYGPEEEITEYRKAVPYFIKRALKNSPMEIYGDGNQTMDLIHVKDCVKATILAANNHSVIEKSVELGSGIETSVNELAQKIKEMTKSSSELKHVEMRAGEDPNTKLHANTEDMIKKLGYSPRISLVDGLEETIEFYQQYG